MKLYEKLKSLDMVEDYKDFMDLIHIRAIKINDIPVGDPIYEIQDNDRIKVGIRTLNVD